MPARGRVMPSTDCGDAQPASVLGMLAQIRSFLTVVEEGSLHRAAGAAAHLAASTVASDVVPRTRIGGRSLERMATGVRPRCAAGARLGLAKRL